MSFKNDEVRSELISALRNREALELERLTYDRKYAEHFFFFLGIVIATDGRMKILSKLKSRLQYKTNSVSPLGL